MSEHVFFIVIGAAVAGIGLVVFAVGSGSGLSYVGLALMGVGGVLSQVDVIGAGVHRGVRSADEERAFEKARAAGEVAPRR